MPKFRKKPIVIEAIQFKDSSCEKAIIDFMASTTDNQGSFTFIGCPAHAVDISTLEGTMRADFGDYIIKGIQGEFYPCKPDIFEATYEKVD